MINIADLFKDSELFHQALQLARGSKAAAYERLEFLGDRVLGLVVAEMLYKNYPKEKEGALAKRFASLTRQETLAKVARLWQLNKLLITTENAMRNNSSILSDVCEAILGVLYLEQGLDAVKALVEPMWKPLMLANIQVPQDPKSACQEWAQKKFKCLPVYETVEEITEQKVPVFKVKVQVENYEAFGVGYNKKEAQKEAARNLLEQLYV